MATLKLKKKTVEPEQAPGTIKMNRYHLIFDPVHPVDQDGWQKYEARAWLHPGTTVKDSPVVMTFYIHAKTGECRAETAKGTLKGNPVKKVTK